jgi:hypothetical protein
MSGSHLSGVVPAKAQGNAHMLRRERKWSVRGVKSGATAFPPPMRGKDREGGMTRTAVASNPMSNKCRSKTSDFQNPRAENKLTRDALSPPPSLSLPRHKGVHARLRRALGGGNRVARIFATFLPRALRYVHALARTRGRQREIHFITYSYAGTTAESQGRQTTVSRFSASPRSPSA